MSRETRISDKVNKNRRRWEHESRQRISAVFKELKKGRAPRAAGSPDEPDPVVSNSAAQKLMERLRDKQEHERALDNLFPRRGRRQRKKTL
jgi:hypothetical protein